MISNNNIQIFNNEEFGSVRTLMIDGEAWFVGKDVSLALGYSNTRAAILSHVDKEDKNTVAIYDGIGNPNQIIINESGLYSLILSSKLDNVKKFKRWVTSEVLPSIKRHGTYISDELLDELESNKDKVTELLRKLKSEQTERKKEQIGYEKLLCEKDELISVMTPKVEFCEEVLLGERLMCVTQIAKDYGLSATAFNSMLKTYDVQYKVGTEELWVLKAKYQAKGYTKTMMIRLKHSNRFKQYTYWTETGREFLYNFLKDRGILPKSEQILQEKISKGIII